MQDGRIAAERYGAGYGPDTRFVSWSMAKTITGVMIGMMVADGLLHLDEPAPVDMWQRPGDPRAEITLRHLLQMRSGLRHTEAGDPPYESSEEIGRAHVCTPVTNAHLVCRLLLEKKNDTHDDITTNKP